MARHLSSQVHACYTGIAKLASKLARLLLHQSHITDGWVLALHGDDLELLPCWTKCIQPLEQDQAGVGERAGAMAGTMIRHLVVKPVRIREAR